MTTRLGSTTFRPLSSDLAQALETYRQANFLPSKNSAINRILSIALLGGGQAATPVAAPAMPAAPPISTPPAPAFKPAPPASLGGWS